MSDTRAEFELKVAAYRTASDLRQPIEHFRRFIRGELGRRQTWADVIEPVYLVGNVYGSHDALRASLRSATDAQILVYAVYYADSEIRNGGLARFFSQSVGILAADANAGFDAIGLPGMAGMIREAMEPFAGGIPPRDHDERVRAMEEAGDLLEFWGPLLERIDRRYLAARTAVRTAHQPATAASAFIRANQDKFFR